MLEILKKANIQIIATALADTLEYGILRIICSQPAEAYRKLKENDVAVALTDVFAIELDNTIGKAADALSIFAKSGISISYLYSFLINGKGILIFRTDNPDKTREVITLNNLSFITEDKLVNFS